MIETPRLPTGHRAVVAAILALLDAAGDGEAARKALVTWHRPPTEPPDDVASGLPYPHYAVDFGALWEAIAAFGFLIPGDYHAWLDGYGRDRLTAGAFAGMSRDDLRMALVYFSRGERFCDGWWAGLIEDGRLHAALARLLALTI